MMYITALLTIGVVVGNICKVVLGAIAFRDEKTGIEISNQVEAGDVAFYQSNSSGNLEVWALNRNTKYHASVSFPSGGGNTGSSHVISPASRRVIPEITHPDILPNSHAVVGLIERTENADDEDTVVKKGFLRLAFKGLGYGNDVRVGAFKLECSTGQLALIVTSSMVITALTTWNFTSSSGTTSTNSEKKVPKSSDGSANDGETRYEFAVNFKQLAMDLENELISGDIKFEVDDVDALIAEMSSGGKSEPLHPVEEAYFKSIGLI